MTSFSQHRFREGWKETRRVSWPREGGRTKVQEKPLPRPRPPGTPHPTPPPPPLRPRQGSRTGQLCLLPPGGGQKAYISRGGDGPPGRRGKAPAQPPGARNPARPALPKVVSSTPEVLSVLGYLPTSTKARTQ